MATGILRTPLAAAALLVAATLCAYAPAFRAEFVWNDDDYLTRPELASLAGLARIWTEPSSTEQYYPLLHSAFWLENRLFGRAPLPYHLVNVVLHCGVALLAWRVLARVGARGALLAAFLFALHPLHVQSVAWVSEQKNTLSGLFGLASVLVWFRFEASAAAGGRRSRGLWIASFLLFACALASKTVTATLPAAILVITWWRDGRIDARRTLLPLAPFFAAALALGATTLWVEKHVGGAETLLAPAQRWLLAGKAPWAYLGHLAWPVGLCFVHPRLDLDPGRAANWAVAATIPAVLVALALTRERRAPLAAALIFGGTLLPALGPLDVYSFVYWDVADHFAYLASLAPLALTAAGIAALATRARMAVAIAACGALAFATYRHARDFQGAETLWRATVACNPRAFLAWTNLASLLNETGRPSEAHAAATAALRAAPDDDRARANLAIALQNLGRPAEALPHLERLVAADPESAVARVNLGNALGALGRNEEALAAYRAAIALEPRRVLAHVNLGNALLASGRTGEALASYARALELEPQSVQAWYNLGVARASSGDFAAAEEAYRRALAIDPSALEARFNLAAVWLQQGRRAEARAGFEDVAARDPGGAIGERARGVLATHLRDG